MIVLRLLAVTLWILGGWSCHNDSRPLQSLVTDGLKLPKGEADEIVSRLAVYLKSEPTSLLDQEINELINLCIDSSYNLELRDAGIFYSIHSKGSGESVKWGDYVSVHYEGRTLDGQVFDSSRSRGEPLDFYVGNVIPGWNDILQNLLTVGSRGIFLIPSSLAYGEEGFGRLVGPSQHLIFDMELISKNPDPNQQKK